MNGKIVCAGVIIIIFFLAVVFVNSRQVSSSNVAKAAFEGQIDIISELDVSQLDKIGYISGLSHEYGGLPPIAWAAIGNRPLIVSMIAEKAPSMLGWSDSRGQTALHYALNSGSGRAATELVRLGAGVFVQDIDGRYPLDVAVSQHEWAVALDLLHYEKNMNFYRKSGIITGAIGVRAYPFDKKYARKLIKHAVVRDLDVSLPIVYGTTEAVEDVCSQLDSEWFAGLMRTFPR